MIVIGFLTDILIFNYQFTFIQIFGSLLILSSLMVGAYLWLYQVKNNSNIVKMRKLEETTTEN